MNNPQLAALEQRTYRAVVDDGLIDILMGLFLVSFGINVYADIDYLPAVFVVLVYPLWTKARGWLIEPRVGHVQLNAARLSKVKRGKRTVMYLLLTLALSMFIFLFFRTKLGLEIPGFGPAFLGVFLGLPIAVGGFLLELKRLIAYGLLLATAGFFEAAGALFDGGSLFLAGGVVGAVGLFLLARFLHRHSPQPEGPSLDV